MRKPLTDAMLAAFIVPRGADRVELWDTVVPRLYLRVSKLGSRTWYLRTTNHSTGRRVRAAIGQWPEMPVLAARSAAILKSTEAAPSPGAPRARFGEVCEAFLTEAGPGLAASTRKEWRRLIATEIEPTLALVDPAAPEFRAAVRGLLDAIAPRSVYTRNRAFELTRRVYSWAVGKDMVPLAPVFAGFEKLVERPRERLLTDDEVARVLAAAALDLPQWRVYWKLLLTGARPGAVIKTEWSDVELVRGEWRLPSESVKGRAGTERAVIVPITPGLARALEFQREITGRFRTVLANLSTGRPVDNPQKASDRVQELSGVDFHVHDLRHYVSTTLARLGTAPHVIDAVMMHTSGPAIRRRSSTNTSQKSGRPSKPSNPTWTH